MEFLPLSLNIDKEDDMQEQSVSNSQGDQLRELSAEKV